MKKNKIAALILAFGMVTNLAMVDTSYATVPNNTQASQSQNPTSFRQEGLSIPEIVKQNQASVVTVSVKVIQNYGILGNKYAEGVGTGFFIDQKGYIATNYHVVKGAQEVTIKLYDGTDVPGRVEWTNEENDLAIVSIDANRYPVPGVVTIGNSDDVVVGEQVVAIGNPMSADFAGTVTQGIISGKNRQIQVGGRPFSYLQTDAAINGGNSGGPLFNSKGEVIGINSAKIAQMEIEGISFAIPINVLISKMKNEPNTSGKTNAPSSIGVVGRDVTAELAQQFNVPTGVMVMDLSKNSPAAQTGLKKEDIITEFAGQRIETIVQLNTVKSQYKPGDTVKIKIFRVSEGKEYEGDITLAPQIAN